MKLSRNLSWLFLTFYCLQQRSDILQHIYFTENLSSAHWFFSCLETENKDPLSSRHPQEMFSTFPGLARCFLRVCSALKACHLLQWFLGTTGTTASLWCCQSRDEIRYGLHPVVIHDIVHNNIYYI